MSYGARWSTGLDDSHRDLDECGMAPGPGRRAVPADRVRLRSGSVHRWLRSSAGRLGQDVLGRRIVHAAMARTGDRNAPSGNAWTGRHRCVHRVPFGSDPPRACWTASRPEALPLASGSVACCSAAFTSRILSSAILSSDERAADVDASRSFDAAVALVGLFSDCARTSTGDAARGRFCGPVFGWDTGAGMRPWAPRSRPTRSDGVAAGVALPGECRRAHEAEDGGLCRRTCRDWNASVDAPGDESGRIDLSAH